MAICAQPPCPTIATCLHEHSCRHVAKSIVAGTGGSGTGEALQTLREMVDHPAHYGGEDNPYEVIKVLYAWDLDKSFCLGNAIKYIARHAHKGAALQDLKKARWYLDEQIKQMENSRGQQDRSA